MDFNGLTFKIIGSVVLFFMFQLFYVFSKVENLEDGKLTLEMEIQSLERKRDNLRLKLMDVEKDVHRSNIQLEKLEVRVRDRLKLLGTSSKNDAMIYFITPTHFRDAQKADLTRLSQTLAQVPNLHWIVVEDSERTSTTVADIIRRTKLPFTHLNAKTRSDQKLKYSDPNWKLPRGVEQRNTALNWIRKQFSSLHKGIIYFGDDDNSYDWRIFNEMRDIKKVGVWPVGIVGGLLVETPVLDENGKVTSFNAIWKPERPFPIDMAAFAVNMTLVTSKSEALFSYDLPRGYQESHFVTSLGLKREDLEPKAENCSKVYVWHTRTEKVKLIKELQRKVADPYNSHFSSLEEQALGL